MTTYNRAPINSIFNHQGDYENGQYSLYSVPEDTMVLFSTINGTPLASLTFRSQDYNPNDSENESDIANSSRTLICQPNPKINSPQRFQGLIAKNHQAITFGITNLTSYFINFNLMLTDEKVNMVDPGGINKVNELKAYQSYWIEADQTKGNRRMILSGVKEVQTDGSTINLSVQQDEQKAKETGTKTKGTYIYLSVVADIISDEGKISFASTVWKKPDYFVIENQPRPRESIWEMYPLVSRGVMPNSSRGSRYDERIAVDFHSNPYICSEMLQCSSQSFSQPEAYINRSGDLLTIPRGVMSSVDSLDSLFSAAGATKSIRSSPVPANIQQIVNQSNAAEIMAGEKLTVRTLDTGNEYNYDLHSNPCIICLSVEENLTFCVPVISPESETIAVNTIIEQYKTGKYADFLAENVLESENCVVCLSEDPTLTYYTCGHKCTHPECDPNNSLTSCPLCRAVIRARLLPINNPTVSSSQSTHDQEFNEAVKLRWSKDRTEKLKALEIFKKQLQSHPGNISIRRYVLLLSKELEVSYKLPTLSKENERCITLGCPNVAKDDIQPTLCDRCHERSDHENSCINPVQ